MYTDFLLYWLNSHLFWYRYQYQLLNFNWWQYWYWCQKPEQINLYLYHYRRKLSVQLNIGLERYKWFRHKPVLLFLLVWHGSSFVYCQTPSPVQNWEFTLLSHSFNPTTNVDPQILLTPNLIDPQQIFTLESLVVTMSAWHLHNS